MTPDDNDKPERGDDDVLAAEYVLGVLPPDERQAVAGRIDREPGFARLVEGWALHFSPLNAGYDEVAPPASVKAALDSRLFGRPAASPASGGFFSSLAFWRGLSAAAVAALLLMVALPFMTPAPVELPVERLVASLASADSDVSYLVVYDSRSGDVALSHVSGERIPDRDLELWVIQGDNAPASLGVIPAGGSVHLPVSAERRERIGAGALFAISVEPSGGSPTGAPTGPVVAAGGLHPI